MALATQCPHCHTTFRVAHDQLKLRAGLVRCGACKQIFNGIENLLRPEEAASVTAATPTRPAPGAAVSTPTASASVPGPEAQTDVPAAVPPNATPPDQQEDVHPDLTASTAEGPRFDEPEPMPPEDPLLRMTLLDFSTGHTRPLPEPVTAAPTTETTETTQATETKEAPEAAPAAAEPQAHEPADALEEAIDDLQRRPLRQASRHDDEQADALDRVDDAGYEEPSFVRQGRRRQRLGQAFEVAMILGSVILLLGLMAQATYTFRDQIAARIPQTRQALNNACTRLGCQVGLPASIDAVTVDASELQAAAPDVNVFTLNVLLRNRGATAQAWPSIELTLIDTNDKPVARRVFGPRDYLSPPEIGKGLAANAEQTVKLSFELAQLKAAGYRVYLFYP